MGQGNYTEKDVREASRAFTGWTLLHKIPRLPYGRFPWKFDYVSEDHDETEKEFLGHKGRLQWRGYHQHRCTAAGVPPVYCPPSVQLLCRRRAASSQLEDYRATR